MSITEQQLKQIIEAAIMAAGGPLTIDKMLSLFAEEKEPPTRDEVKAAIKLIEEECETRGVELKKISSGYRFQAKKDFAPWISLLWEEKPARYSRALLETLVLIAYKQPLTRGEIEHVRGVAVSSHIIKTLLERDWVKVVGHRDVPGKPALYATTKAFLDYFNLNSLEEMPTLAEIRDLDKINAELDLQDPGAEAGEEAARKAADMEAAIEDAVDENVEGTADPENTVTEEDIDSNLEDRDDIALPAGEARIESDDVADEAEQPLDQYHATLSDEESPVESDDIVDEPGDDQQIAGQLSDDDNPVTEAVIGAGEEEGDFSEAEGFDSKFVS